MTLYIVLPVKLLKLRTEIFVAFVVFVCAAYVPAQSMDTLRVKYNYLNSVPQNAEVYVNNDLVGNTPLYFVWGDSVFPKQVRVTLRGYSDYVDKVESPEELHKTYTLIPKKGVQTLDPVSRDKQLYFEKQRKLVPIVISSVFSLGAGAAAYYFKSLAIDYRNIYEQTGEQWALDKKKKYDLLSGISVVVFQAGLGALIYFLLID